MVRRAWLWSSLWVVISACGDSVGSDVGDDDDRDAGTQTQDGSVAGEDGEASLGSYVRGRVTDPDGKPLADVEVRTEKSVGRTDSSGRFELMVEDAAEGKEVGVSVEGSKYSTGTVPVRVTKSADANVELTVKERKMVILEDSKTGGRVQVDDGFAVELPAAALSTSRGLAVEGPVEVRYTVVSDARDVVALPGRMQSSDKVALDGYGMVEVAFFQDGERLVLNKTATYEMPLVADSGLEDGKEIPAYLLTAEDKRWQKGASAMVKSGKVVVRSDHDGWVGAAKELPADSCVAGRLKASADRAAPNTTIRAARARGLSLVQTDTADDGSFCLPVTPDDDWQVSAYFADGKADSLGIQVSVNSSQAAGMCGGDGCKQVGEVELPAIKD